MDAHLWFAPHGLWILLLVRLAGCDQTTISSSASLMGYRGTVIKPESVLCLAISGYCRTVHGLPKLYYGIMSPLKGGAGSFSRVVADDLKVI